jgi:hypothetical protein
MEMTMTNLFTTAAFTLALLGQAQAGDPGEVPGHLGFSGEQERHPDNDWCELNQPWTELQV